MHPQAEMILGIWLRFTHAVSPSSLDTTPESRLGLSVPANLRHDERTRNMASSLDPNLGYASYTILALRSVCDLAVLFHFRSRYNTWMLLV
jgi:hypothetical protein